MSALSDILTDRRRQVERDKVRGTARFEGAARRPEDRLGRFLMRLNPGGEFTAGDAAARDEGEAAGEYGHTVIAEIKRRSPSKGDLRPHLDPASLARQYERAGASAISVLTEESRFGGSFDDLAAVSGTVGIAVLCKDFVIDPFQIRQARDAGADLILLMVSVLGLETAHYVRLARAAGLEPLVEVHSEPELDVAVEAGARVIGVNNRDLRTLKVDLDVCRALLPLVPDDALPIAESGITAPEELDELSTLGARGFLVGESLVTAPDPGASLVRLVRTRRSSSNGLAGRSAAEAMAGWESP
jgi:indole-3-glycerol phosphate synthase